MEISTKQLKEELTGRQEELKNDLTPRVESMLEVVETEILKEENIHLFDLIVHIIIKADRTPVEYIVKLIRGINTEDCDQLDGWLISKSVGLVEDYFEREKMAKALVRERNRHGRYQ